MGKKYAVVWASVIVLSSNSLVASAETVDDLYKLYDIDKTVKVSEEVSDVIDSYNDMKRFVAMYNYIDLSVPDTTKQDNQVSELERRIIEIDAELFDGFDLSITEIINLESERHSACESIDRINNTRQYSAVEIDFPDADKVPDYVEYLSAIKETMTLEESKNLGDVSHMALPIDNGSILYHTDQRIDVSSGLPARVRCVFSGTVVEVTDNTVTIETIGDITLTYSNLLTTTVVVGDAVRQYDYIGSTASSVSITMSIDNKRYDMWRLFN